MTLSESGTASGHAALSEKLDDPQVASALVRLLDHMDLLALLTEGLDQFVARSEVIGDSLVAGLTEIREAEGADSVDLGALVSSGMSLARALPQAAPGMVYAVESGAMDKLLASGVVSAEALPQVEMLARATARGSAEFARNPIEVGGALSLLRLLKDPDINRALSFFATVAKTVGQELAANPPAAPSGH